MNQTIWNARLNPSSPRYLEWRKIFDEDEIPLVSSIPFQAKLGEETDTIFLLDWFQIVGEESDRMLDFFAQKFSASRDEVEKTFDQAAHIPIRSSDVIISYSVKVFI